MPTSRSLGSGAGALAQMEPAEALPDFELPPSPLAPSRFSSPAFVKRESVGVYNFSPGPAQLPDSVLARAHDEFLGNWAEAPGQSPMCVSHREADGAFQKVLTKAMDGIRSVLDVPENYHVLFMQGGAHAQFSSVPLNLCGTTSKSVACIDTGFWSRRAADEFGKYAPVRWVASADPGEALAMDASVDRGWWACGAEQHKTLPPSSSWAVDGERDAFVHVCANETINGIELLDEPGLGPDAPPLVGDFTSTLLSRPVDVSQYGVLYCSGGKNLGPAGVTLALVRDDLLTEENEHPMCPSVLSYRKTATTTPMPNLYATPPTYAVYMVALTLEDLAARGGVQWASKRASHLSSSIYEAIDSSGGFYENTVDTACRSRISVPFRVRGSSSRSAEEATNLEKLFLAEAEAVGFRHIAGHPISGGVRASLYNGVPDVATEALVDFMHAFRREHA